MYLAGILEFFFLLFQKMGRLGDGKRNILWDGPTKMTLATVKPSILGFHVTSQALLKLVSAMLVSLGCQIYTNNRPFLQ